MEAHLALAEVPNSLLQLDIMLPSQRFGPPRKQAPEQRLMIAVLLDAVECFDRYRFATSGHGHQLFDDAQQWFLAHETRWPYSFECICGVLDLDADAVRQRLRLTLHGHANGGPSETAVKAVRSRLPAIAAGRQMAQMERELRVAGNCLRQRQVLATLGRWQLDPTLDSASRQRASALLWKFQANGWDEV